MEKIYNGKVLDKYISQYHMDQLFTKDMRSYMELFYYQKNEFIVRDSEKMSYLIFLVNGKAKVFTTLSNGKSLLLCFYQDFKVLGDLEITGSPNAVTNIQVLEDTICIGIPIEKVKVLLMEDAKFLRFICGSLGDKLYRCSKNSSINLLYSLENRLASYIYTAGDRIKDSDGRKTKIIFKENMTEIAELLGTSYRHLLRTLKGLYQKGVLRKVNDGYEVLDELHLTRLSADLYR
ncbi:cyclic nucleotide-binding domain-containing protein [Anaerocolumna sp. MB42-C2]|uniref:cyclic nucleotide-binding domain-containing protein n=1 Tax=Anaerocolumna sp. MB42-C2 TaxID=3070997 RepID=UPI0027DF0C80|nr:cyclic nucleotide-binding domain-containing protein [Anaerocolumna sp. MB42-C2]WMJ87225.1 cyclic nucleotide-binding domain-containing protein [Anaerocolumna sp. MB42-C2]